jgi:hypothetical protein
MGAEKGKKAERVEARLGASVGASGVRTRRQAPKTKWLPWLYRGSAAKWQ